MTQDTTRPRAPAPLPPLLRDLWRLLRRQSPITRPCPGRAAAIAGPPGCDVCRRARRI